MRWIEGKSMTGIDLKSGKPGAVPVVRLNSGHDLPVIGLGTYALRGSACVNAVNAAIQSGYRLIDTASFYGNEREVGEGIRKSGVLREEIFVQTKLYPNQYTHAAKAIEEAGHRLHRHDAPAPSGAKRCDGLQGDRKSHTGRKSAGCRHFLLLYSGDGFLFVESFRETGADSK